MMKRRLNIFSVLVVSALVFNCSGNKKEDVAVGTDSGREAIISNKDKVTEVAAPQFDVDKKFQNQLGDVLNAYVSLKEAFVSSDAEKVKSEAIKTNESVGRVDMSLLSGVAHNDWMVYLSPMQKALEEIQGSSDIEDQRKFFSTLSDNLYKSIKAFGLGGKEAYYEYCPMAFNNEGGYWLSDDKKIRNPYFGDKMLTCGEVKESLR